MKKIGIITIHRIYNYGSVLQAYALQQACENLGYKSEIIDYIFPNLFHATHKYDSTGSTQPNEPKWIKILFGMSLVRQHKGIQAFVSKYQHFSPKQYNSPDELKADAPSYDVYITGSDQLWNPRHCGGDPSFLLHFSPDSAKRLSYAASIGSNAIPSELHALYKELLSRYDSISVRENSGVDVVREICGKEAEVVLDPTLLLDYNDWNKIALPRRLVRGKYILCYFLNYSFNAFPYVNNLAASIQKQTGYKLVWVARPPHDLSLHHIRYQVGARPEEFLSLVRDCEMVLTTSFHGTAFAVNYGKPVFTVVEDRNAPDSRQVSLMNNLGLTQQIVSIHDNLPKADWAYYDRGKEQQSLSELRGKSQDFLIAALK